LKALQKTLIFLFLCLAILSLYVFLHEGGHALAVVVQDGQLTEFDLNPLNAHVNFYGNLTPSGRAVMNISGASLPLLVWFAWMLAMRRRDNPAVESVKLVAMMGVLNTLLVWMIIPFLYLGGNAPAGDDVTHFLDNSGMHPLMLAAGALLVYILGWLLYSRRSVGLVKTFFLMRDPAPWEPGHVRAPIIWGGLIMILVWGTAIALKTGLPGAAAQIVEPPAGYVRAAHIDLNTGDFDDFELAHFTLSSPGGPGIFLEIHDIDTSFFEVRLVGSNAYEKVILRGEGYSTTLDTARLDPDPTLPAGEYELLLTSRQSPGTLTIYIQQP
jgi:hypothetical protein